MIELSVVEIVSLCLSTGVIGMVFMLVFTAVLELKKDSARMDEKLKNEMEKRDFRIAEVERQCRERAWDVKTGLGQ